MEQMSRLEGWRKSGEVDAQEGYDRPSFGELARDSGEDITRADYNAYLEGFDNYEDE